MRCLTLPLALVVTLLTGLASAEPIIGEWRTEPDGKGQTGDVRIVPCGTAFCGTIVRAFDDAGTPITTRNVGREVLIGMRPTGEGYAGRVFVPIMGAEFDAQVNVSGQRMVLRACNGMGMCRTQEWRRVQ